MNKTVDNYISFDSKESFSSLKGYLAIAVLLHHVYQFSGLFKNTYFGHFLQLLGSWSVAVFIFMSAYGLYVSYSEKGIVYIKELPRKRILPFYLTYVFFVIIYLLYFLMSHVHVTAKQILLSFTYTDTIVSFGWYFQLSYLLYIVTYLIFRYTKHTKTHVFLFLLFGVLYYAVMKCIGMDFHRITPIFSFLLGLTVASHREKINTVMCKHNVLISLFSFILLFTGYLLYIYSNIMCTIPLNQTGRIILQIITELSVVLFCYSFLSVSSQYFSSLLINPISSFLGKKSLEIYACQGLVLNFFVNKMSNQYIFALVAILSTIFIGTILNKLLTSIKSII